MNVNLELRGCRLSKRQRAFLRNTISTVDPLVPIIVVVARRPIRGRHRVSQQPGPLLLGESLSDGRLIVEFDSDGRGGEDSGGGNGEFHF